jgi:hypothetical protein
MTSICQQPAVLPAATLRQCDESHICTKLTNMTLSSSTVQHTDTMHSSVQKIKAHCSTVVAAAVVAVAVLQVEK